MAAAEFALPGLVLRGLPTPLLGRLMRQHLWRRLLSPEQIIAAWNRLGCSLDSACLIEPRVHFTLMPGGGVSVGSGSLLTGTIDITAWCPVTIGRNVLINHDVRMLTGSHDVTDPGFEGVVRPIVIEDNAWIAQGAVILPGVTIGEGAVVGAYAVVGSDVRCRTVVAGNPAKVLRERPLFDPTFIPAEQKRRARGG